jgi:hypothetical protein
MMTKSVPPAVQAAAEALREAIHGVAELISTTDGLLDYHDMAVRPRHPFCGVSDWSLLRRALS